jgi:hypothetical protein
VGSKDITLEIESLDPTDVEPLTKSTYKHYRPKHTTIGLNTRGKFSKERYMPSLPISYLIFIAMSSPIAINILLPALPHIAKQLNVDISLVQLSYSLYLCSLAVIGWRSSESFWL